MQAHDPSGRASENLDVATQKRPTTSPDTPDEQRQAREGRIERAEQARDVAAAKPAREALADSLSMLPFYEARGVSL